MTVTERLTADFVFKKACGVTFPPGLGTWGELSELRYPAIISPWINFVLPVQKEESSFQVTEIWLPTETETREFIPRTPLGKKLIFLRKRAIASGMPLLDEDEVLEEVKRRRGETEYNETNLY